MPKFEDAASYVAYKVFKQTRTRLGADTFEVVDRFLITPGSRIVRTFDNENEANAFRDELRAKRMNDLAKGRVS